MTPVPIQPPSPVVLDTDDPSTLDLDPAELARQTAERLAELDAAYKGSVDLGEPISDCCSHNATGKVVATFGDGTTAELTWNAEKQLYEGLMPPKTTDAEPFPHDEPILHNPALGDDCLCALCSLRVVGQGIADEFAVAPCGVCGGTRAAMDNGAGGIDCPACSTEHRGRPINPNAKRMVTTSREVGK